MTTPEQLTDWTLRDLAELVRSMIENVDEDHRLESEVDQQHLDTSSAHANWPARRVKTARDTDSAKGD